MEETFSNALILAAKDFMQLKRNRMAIFLSLILLPGFFTATLVSAEGGESMGIQTQFVPVAVADEDGTASSQAFHQSLSDSRHLGTVLDAPTRDSAEQLLGTGAVAAVIVIPQGFGDSVKLHQATAILVILDDSKPGIPEGVYDTVSAIAQQYSANVNFQDTQQMPVEPVEMIDRGKPVGMLTIGVGIVLGFVQVFACFFEVAGGMVREKEAGTLSTLVLAKASDLSIILGKTIYSSILTLIRSGVVLAIAIYAYDVAVYGNILVVIFVAWAMGIATMGLALILAAFRVSGRTVVISEFFLIIVLFAFGGLIRDRDLMTGYALMISNLLPWTYGFDALRKTFILDWGVAGILPELGMLTLYSLVFYGAALFLFHARRESLGT